VKKIIIGMLLLIPIIVILIVSATAALVSGAYIAVEGVEIYWQNENGQLTLADDTMLGYLGHDMQLVAIITPEHATNKGVSWRVENEVRSMDSEVLTVNQKGLVNFYGLGEADVVVETEDGSKTDVIHFIVTSSDVMSINIINIPAVISVGDRVALEAELKPADAKTEQRFVDWKIKKGTAAQIDRNGILTALSAGSVTVRATMTNPPAELQKYNKHIAEVTLNIVNRDSSQPFKSQYAIYTEGDSLNIQNTLINQSYSSKNSLEFECTPNAQISGGELRLIGGFGGKNIEEVTLFAKLGDSVVGEITVYFKQIHFENSDLWRRYDEDSVCMLLGSPGLYYAVSSQLNNVSVTVGDDKVIKIEDGRLVPLKAGETTVNATAGGVSEKINIVVLPPIYNVVLNNDSTKDKLGIAQERVFGSMTYNFDGMITNEIPFDVVTIFTQVDGMPALIRKQNEIKDYYKYLNFTVDKEGFSISSDGVLSAANVSDLVTVQVSAAFPVYSTSQVSDSYTAKIIKDAVNVGLVSLSNSLSEDERNEFALEGFNKVNLAVKDDYDIHGNNPDYKQKYSIVMHGDITLGGVDNPLYTSINGNGFYFRQFKENEEMDGATDIATLRIVVSDVTVENVIIRAARALRKTDNGQNESLWVYKEAGNGVVIDGRLDRGRYFPQGATDREERLKNINLRYVIVENVFYAVYVAAADVNITGAILRNSGNQTLYINTSVQNVSDDESGRMNSVVTLKNTVFSNSINMSIGLITEDLDPELDAKVSWVDKEGKDRYDYGFVKYFEDVTDSVLDFEGFCKIYNWKKAEELDFSYIGVYFDTNSQQGEREFRMVTETIASLLQSADSFFNQLPQSWQNFRCVWDGVSYYQLAVANLGVHYPISGVISQEDLNSIGLTSVADIELDFVAKLVKAEQFASKINYGLKFYCYNNTNPLLNPLETYVANDALFKDMKK